MRHCVHAQRLSPFVYPEPEGTLGVLSGGEEIYGGPAEPAPHLGYDVRVQAPFHLDWASSAHEVRAHIQDALNVGRPERFQMNVRPQEDL